MYISSTTWQTVWRFQKDLEPETPFDPVISLLGVYPKECKDTCTHIFIVALYNSKDLEPTQMPINDRLDKENMAHISNGILCSHEKKMTSCPSQGYG